MCKLFRLKILSFVFGVKCYVLWFCLNGVRLSLFWWIFLLLVVSKMVVFVILVFVRIG